MPTEEPIEQLQDDASLVDSACDVRCEEAESGPPNIAESPAPDSSPASESSAAPAPPKKGWFSHTFFLVMVTFAMCMSAVNTWIGPDNQFVSRQLAGEDLARQQELITKLVLRLRRAELLMDRQRISEARESLAEGLLFMKENNQDLPLIASDVENRDFKIPWSPKYKALFNMYERSQMYRQEANLMKDLDAEMISSAVLIGPTNEFYKHAAEINTKLGDAAEAQRYLDKVDRWDLVPHQISQWDRGPDFNQACRDLLDGNFAKARSGFLRLTIPSEKGLARHWDPQYDYDYIARAKVMLAILPVAEGKHGPDVDRGLKEAEAELGEHGWEHVSSFPPNPSPMGDAHKALLAAIARNEQQKKSAK